MIYEKVEEYTKTIEGLLIRKFGATGKGLHEKTTSVEMKLPALVVQGIRTVASISNKLMHDEGFTPESIPPHYERLCNEIEEWLSDAQREENPITPLSKQKKVFPPCRHNEGYFTEMARRDQKDPDIPNLTPDEIIKSYGMGLEDFQKE